MATTTRQSTLLVNQDWTKLYQAFREADFQSYDFQTLRKTMIDYLRTYYPEDFNDFIESSEYVALIDLIAFLGQSLAFRTDLNARENFIDTAERRDSVLKLARLISYNPKRNSCASGYLKVSKVSTTEQLFDSNGFDLTNISVNWNDSTNNNWLEQFTTIINAALGGNQVVGKPSNSQTINGIINDEYQINLVPNTLPVYKFSTQVENVELPFEICSATSAGEPYVYEVAPRPSRALGFLYRNDNLGNDSVNTGFFMYFKQGNLSYQDFILRDSIPNRVVNINKDNVNNSDVWLYKIDNNNNIVAEWGKIPAVSGVNIVYNNNAARNSFQVNSRANDQIDLVFGDGTFAAVPQGTFRCYYRQSAGLTYKITPDEMQNISVPISYVSRVGRVETITFTVDLQYTVANAASRETLDEIRTKAPQQYYTQNRMVTGEDYNIFPYTNFNSVAKAKAINRTSSGVSRYLDVVDVTGKYSSTNIFAQDGYLYREVSDTSFDFTWSTANDINRVIKNQVLPVVRGQGLQHFYYENFPRISVANVYWFGVTNVSGNSTGYFVNSVGETLQVGEGVSNELTYIRNNALLVFSPGEGKYFDAQNEIKPLPESGKMPMGGQALLYSTLVNLVGNGDSGVQSNGQGPVALNQVVPAGAQVSAILPAFSNDFNSTTITEMIAEISAYRDFGVRYDQESGSWAIVTNQNIDFTSPFSTNYQGSTSGLNLDSSWLVSFKATGPIYSVRIRGLNYIFESEKETKFYFDNSVKIFDPKTGLSINDQVNILKVNGNPDSGEIYSEDISWFVYNQLVEADGYVDRSKILVTFADSDNDGVPDNPDIFNLVVSPEVSPEKKLVFFQKTYGYDSFVSYKPVDSALFDVEYPTLTALFPSLNLYVAGQLWYMTAENKFYQGQLINNTLTPIEINDYVAKVGRQDLYFQYRHNSPNYRRIDPSPNNIIDLYLLTKTYETDYRAWVIDMTGKVQQPVAPSSEELRIQYSDLENYKSVSDAIVYNSAKYKPLFGNKALPELQATFKVVKNPQINLSDSEVKAQVLALINSYFATNNWDFGETFYFSELSAYLHQALAPNISSIVIVPNNVNYPYGSLQEITAAPDEILISAATIDNIEIIDSITAAQLGLQNQTVNTNIS